jgi:hypothetical protein
MTWITLYISGKSDFRDTVRKRLDHSDLNFMPGYTDNVPGNDHVHDLYWIDDAIDLRFVKEEIGAKNIWKYRLQFFLTLEEFIQHQEKISSQQKNQEENFPLLEV